jgi:undecaprenyl pyrophosphate phosphatase UppP
LSGRVFTLSVIGRVLLQPSGLLVPYMPVAVVGMTGADASEETGLFQVVAIQPGTSRPGL